MKTIRSKKKDRGNSIAFEQLTRAQIVAVAVWMQDRIDEAAPDEDSIAEEYGWPLLSGLRGLRAWLDAQRRT